MAAQSNDFEMELFPDSLILRNFYSQIHSVPELIDQANAISTHFKHIQENAQRLLQEFDEDKESLLKGFNSLLLPAAKEVIKELSDEAEQLKDNLDITIQNPEAVSNMDWIQHAKSWVHLYARWKNQRGLNEQVLQVASDRTHQLIDRDIKVIQDYQSHSLSSLSEEDKERLQMAIEEPLKGLISLKKAPQNASVRQVSEWIAGVHQKRESYFDHVLTKIDSVVKEIVQHEEVHHSFTLGELEHEILFIEKELNQVQTSLNHQLGAKEKEHLLFQLNSLQEHLEELNVPNHFEKLKCKIKICYDKIRVLINQLS